MPELGGPFWNTFWEYNFLFLKYQGEPEMVLAGPTAVTTKHTVASIPSGEPPPLHVLEHLS